jgi:hypothetical protein
MALRPRSSASWITSRKGSHSDALGARSGAAAVFELTKSVDTSLEMAGFDFRGRPRPRTSTPAALRYALAVARRTDELPANG